MTCQFSLRLVSSCPAMGKVPAKRSASNGQPPRVYEAGKGKPGYRVFLGRKYLAYFRFKKDADKCVRERLAAAKPGQGKCAGPRAYKHVMARRNKTYTVYYGKVHETSGNGHRTTKYFQVCDSPAEAANQVAKYLQEDVKSMKVRRNRREWTRPSADRMAFMSGVFRGWMPADLASAIAFRRRGSSLQVSCPGAYVAGLLGKEDRWKDMLLQVWEAMLPRERAKLHGLGSRDESLAKEGAQVLHGMLSMALALWAGWSIPKLGHMPWPRYVKATIVAPPPAKATEIEEDRRWWAAHVHRGVLHHLSLLPLALRWGIVTKTPRKQGSLRVANDQGEYYSLTPFVAKEHVEVMQSLHRTGVLLGMVPIPHTNKEWAEALTKADTVADAWECKRSAYHWPWLVRVYLIAEMRHAGVHALQVTQDWKEKKLRQALKPDQSEWLPLWLSRLARGSLKRLLRRLKFKEPLELLSCFACVMADAGIMSYTTEELRQNTERIAKVRQEMHKQMGREAHPSMVLREAMVAQ